MPVLPRRSSPKPGLTGPASSADASCVRVREDNTFIRTQHVLKSLIHLILSSLDLVCLSVCVSLFVCHPLVFLPAATGTLVTWFFTSSGNSIVGAAAVPSGSASITIMPQNKGMDTERREVFPFRDIDSNRGSQRSRETERQR